MAAPRGLAAAVAPGRLVAVDTMAFIYHIEAAPRYAAAVAPFFAALAQGVFEAVTSVLSLMELAVRPLQLGRQEVADDYEVALLTYPHLRVVDVDRSIARRAAELRAAYRLRPADAVQVATALVSGATAIVTNDAALARVRGLEVLVIDSYLPDEGPAEASLSW